MGEKEDRESSLTSLNKQQETVETMMEVNYWKGKFPPLDKDFSAGTFYADTAGVSPTVTFTASDLKDFQEQLT